VNPVEYQSRIGTVIVRNPEFDDIPALLKLHFKCFPSLADEEGGSWRKDQLRSHIEIFPEGQMVVEHEGAIIAASSSLIVSLGKDPLRPHTYNGITDDGYFYNHDMEGDTLYGAEVYVDPDYQGKGIAAILYDFRRDLCIRFNLRRILSGGRMVNYIRYKDSLSPEEYVEKVKAREIDDPVLGFQLSEGFVVRDIMPNYLRDPRSTDFATLIEWLNPDYQHGPDPNRKIRVACVQYQVRKINSFEDFANQVEYFVETAADDYSADFVVLPEFFSVQLLSQITPLSPLEGIRHLAELTPNFENLMSGLARKHGVHIVAGSHPVMEDGKLYNMGMFFRPDGSSVGQPKLHITPSEKTYWGIDGGNSLVVIQTPRAKIGILICYDIEFPEAARMLADQGVEVIFVPYCTDNRQGYIRVRTCAHARAIENQIYVVTAGIIGNLPDVPAMDIHYGRASVFTPSDFEFARDGIQAEADSNIETLLVTDLDLSDLYRSRRAGSVTPLQDRRPDLFEVHSPLVWEHLERGTRIARLPKA